MAKKAFDKIMAGLDDAQAFLAGDDRGAVVHNIPAVDVRAIRAKVGGSREVFSRRFGLDCRAVQDWEQGRRTPDRSTRILMLMIEHDPKNVERTVTRVLASGKTIPTATGKRIIRGRSTPVVRRGDPLRGKTRPPKRKELVKS